MPVAVSPRQPRTQATGRAGISLAGAGRLLRVLRFRPTALVAIYFRPSWIFAAYLVSRICRVPLVYYVHDALATTSRASAT